MCIRDRAIGERTAEDIKIKVGSAVPLKDELDVEVNGRDVITGLPKTCLLYTSRCG